MEEIGGEFCTLDFVGGGAKIENYFEDSTVLTLLGREAISCIIEDISVVTKIKRILFPNYYCKSMIEPFKNRGIDVYFYPASFDRTVKINLNDYPRVDAVFIIQYFGFHQAIELLNKRNEVVIEDITHSFFLKCPCQQYSDYLTGSVRKWMPLSVGVAVKMDGMFHTSKPFTQFNEYIDLITRARALKSSYYLCPQENCKSEYLSMFQESHTLIETNAMIHQGESDVFCCNPEELISKRRENAQFIIEQIREWNSDLLYFDALQDEDVPLFVPIKIPSKFRSTVRQHMIHNKVYLPIHWPKSDESTSDNSYFEEEISLVCDQRYEIEDMEHIIMLLKQVL